MCWETRADGFTTRATTGGGEAGPVVVNLGQWWWVPGVSVSKLSSASGPEQCEQPEAHRCTGHGDAGTVLPARCLAGSGGESGDDIPAQPQSAVPGQERHATEDGIRRFRPRPGRGDAPFHAPSRIQASPRARHHSNNPRTAMNPAQATHSHTTAMDPLGCAR